jgi:molybdopterin synthase sulfur carrier subunit
MRVHVKLFATLRQHVPNAVAGLPFEVDLAEEATVADLIHHLSLPAEEVKIVYVNARAQADDWRLGPGDEIGIFPPIGGG